MRLCLALCMILSLPVAFVGCEKKAEVKKETTVTTPEGKMTETQTDTVKQSGDAPPADAK